MQNKMTTEEILEFFMNETSGPHTPPQHKIEALSKINIVAAVIGPDNTKNKLVPFLRGLHSLEDEAFTNALVDSYSTLKNYVGSDIFDIQKILENLEDLSKHDDILLRKKALKIINEIILDLPPQYRAQIIHMCLIPMIQRLQEDCNIASRITSCELLLSVYISSDTVNKRDLRNVYIKLCADESLMVQKEAAMILAGLVEQHSDNSLIENYFFPIFSNFWKATSCQEDMKEILIIELLEILEKLDDSSIQIFANVFLFASTDRSLKVRHTFASNLTKFYQLAPVHVRNNQLMTSIKNLLGDSDSSIKIRSFETLVEIEGNLSDDCIKSCVVPALCNIMKDRSTYLKCIILSSIIPIFHRLENKNFLTMLVTFLVSQSSSEYNEAVCKNILSNIETISNFIEQDDIFFKFLVTLCSFAANSQWRVRECVAKNIDKFLECKRINKNCKKYLEFTIIKCLLDPAHCVRKGLISRVSNFHDKFGKAWVLEFFIPNLISIYNKNYFLIDGKFFPVDRRIDGIDYSSIFSSMDGDFPDKVLDQEKFSKKSSSEATYTVKITILHALNELFQHLSLDEVVELLFPIINQGINDKVSNVRFVAFGILISLMETKVGIENPEYTKIEECIKVSMNDDDVEIRRLYQQYRDSKNMTNNVR